MTLGITILSPEAIYQSADQILVRSGKRLKDPSGKNITLQYFDWTAYVTYAGIGQDALGRDTSAIAKGWFAGIEALAFDEAVERLRASGTDWLRRVARRAPHTFVLAAFVDGVAACAVISNHQEWHGAPLAAVADELKATTVRAPSTPTIIVIGQPQAVHRADKTRLRRLAADHADDPRRIRLALEQESRRAAERLPSKISAECLVFSLDKYGNGQMHPSGELVAQPEFLMNGVDFRAQLEALGITGGQLVGMTSVTSGHGAPPPRTCNLDLSDMSPHYELLTLEPGPGGKAYPRAVNQRGVVAGSASPAAGAPAQPCIWPDPNQLVFLPTLGGIDAGVLDIDETGTCGGYSETEGQDRISHACIWTPDREVIDKGRDLVRHSRVGSIGPDGYLGGYVSIDPTKGGQDYQRPAVWSPDGGPEVIEELGGRCGEVRAFGPNGEWVIPTRTFGILGRAGGALFDREGLRDVQPPDSDPNGFIPFGMLEDGRLIATALGSNRRGVAMAPSGHWADLLPVGLEIASVSTGGWVVGHTMGEDYRRAWIWSVDGGEPIVLPSWRLHDTHATAVAINGVIVGAASTERCSHPLLWRPIGGEAARRERPGALPRIGR